MMSSSRRSGSAARKEATRPGSDFASATPAGLRSHTPISQTASTPGGVMASQADAGTVARVTGWPADAGVTGWSADAGVTGWSADAGVTGWSADAGVTGWSADAGVTGWSADAGVTGWSADVGVTCWSVEWARSVSHTAVLTS